jgi:hypothetical protein
MELFIDLVSFGILSMLIIGLLFLVAIPVSVVVGGIHCATSLIEEFMRHHPDAHKTSEISQNHSYEHEDLAPEMKLKNVS